MKFRTLILVCILPGLIFGGAPKKQRLTKQEIERKLVVGKKFEEVELTEEGGQSLVFIEDKHYCPKKKCLFTIFFGYICMGMAVYYGLTSEEVNSCGESG